LAFGSRNAQGVGASVLSYPSVSGFGKTLKRITVRSLIKSRANTDHGAKDFCRLVKKILVRNEVSSSFSHVRVSFE
jgi:hypothetical protein